MSVGGSYSIDDVVGDNNLGIHRASTKNIDRTAVLRRKSGLTDKIVFNYIPDVQRRLVPVQHYSAESGGVLKKIMCDAIAVRAVKKDAPAAGFRCIGPIDNVIRYEILVTSV